MHDWGIVYLVVAGLSWQSVEVGESIIYKSSQLRRLDWSHWKD